MHIFFTLNVLYAFDQVDWVFWAGVIEWRWG